MRKLVPWLLLGLIVSTAQAQATTCIAGAKGAAPSATITFTAPTTNTDGTPITLPLTLSLIHISRQLVSR